MIADRDAMPARAQNLRRNNLGSVLDHLRRDGPATRSRLVAATGLTRSAIAGLVEELVALGLVAEDAALPDGSPGRPSPVVRVETATVSMMAIDIGVDGIGVAEVALDGSVLRSARLVRTRDRAELEQTLDDIVDMVRRLGSSGTATPNRRLLGIGVAVPGLVRARDNVVATAPNLGWTDVALSDLLDARLGLGVPVRVGNEADLGALAEARFGAGVGADHMIYVHGEVGVGGGLVVNGRRLAGHSGYSGEIGHFPVNPNGSPCMCGSTGCWETEVGEPAMLARAGLDPDGGDAAVDELLHRLRSGDASATAAMAEEGRWLGLGLAGLINVFDADVVVLGGLFAVIFDVVREPMEAELARRRFHDVDRRVPVVEAQLGPDDAFIGAAELGFAVLVDDPAVIASG